MKVFNFIIILFLSQVSKAGGNAGLMFMPQLLPTTILNWDIASFQFDGTGAATTTFTLTNLGAKKSGNLSLSLKLGHVEYSVLNNNCAGMQLDSFQSCTVDVSFSGSISVIPSQTLRAIDGTGVLADSIITNCPGC